MSPEELQAENARLAARVAELEARLADPAMDRAGLYRSAELARINAITPSVMYILDIQKGHPTWVGGRIGSVMGLSREEIAEGASARRGRMIHEEDRGLVIGRLFDLHKLPDGEVRDLEFRINHADGSTRWVLDRAVVYERDDEGRITKTLSAAIDIDDRKRAEERRSTLINELNHRLKNILAAVQLIARQTLRPGRPAEQAEALFSARLVALSGAHDILTRENWAGADLREIVEDALRPFSEPGAARFVVDGPDLRLGSRAAVALALALHELATNAAKHGALSTEAGRVSLTWPAPGPNGVTEIEWREIGGPPVEPPARSGFGSRLLTQGLAADLARAAHLEFARDGVICRIAAPVEPARGANPG